MSVPTSSYATAGIALRVSGALKPHHHDKVETPSMGKNEITTAQKLYLLCYRIPFFAFTILPVTIQVNNCVL
jgi:hypothetical protein